MVRESTQFFSRTQMKKCLQCGTEADTNFCPNCGSEMKEVPHLSPERSKTTSDIEPTIPSTPRPGQGMKAKKPIYKRVWFIILVIIVVLGIVGCFASGDENTETASHLQRRHLLRQWLPLKPRQRRQQLKVLRWVKKMPCKKLKTT